MDFNDLLDRFKRAIEQPMEFSYKVDMNELFYNPTRELIREVDNRAVDLLNNADKILDICKAFETEVDRMGGLITPEQRKQFEKIVDSARQKSREHRAQWRIIYKQIQHLNQQLNSRERDYHNHPMLYRD
jgi:6-pyruvoyl-tetrahydropterin synthase